MVWIIVRIKYGLSKEKYVEYSIIYVNRFLEYVENLF